MAEFADPRKLAGVLAVAAALACAPAAAQDASLDRRLQGMLDSFEQRFSIIEDQLRHLTTLLERLERSQSDSSRETLGLIDEISLQISELRAFGTLAPDSGPPVAGDGQAGETLGDLRAPVDEEGNPVPEAVPDSDDLLIEDLLAEVGGGGSAEESEPRDPREQYQAARDLLLAYQWREAIGAFSGFLEIHSDHELAEDAKYFLGEAYYANEDYGNAAAAFLRLVEEHGESARLASSWMRIGMSFYHEGKREFACRAFGQVAGIPNVDPADLDRLQREQSRAECG